MRHIFVIDFDSTFITVEALDELSAITLIHNPQKNKIIKKIAKITKDGMEGKIDFSTSLEKRFYLFKPQKKDIVKLIGFLKKRITPSVIRNKNFFQKYKKNIYIISGGFKEYIYPVVKDFGIRKDHIFANNFTYDKYGEIDSFDKSNFLAQANGKSKTMNLLKTNKKIIVIGDGITDYQIKQQGKADKFFAFVENVNRKVVTAKADRILKNFDEVFISL